MKTDTKPFNANSVLLRPVETVDMEFLFHVYANTRAEEMALTGWDEVAIEQFLRSQFSLREEHYHSYYSQANFDVILLGDQAIGYLYVERSSDELRVVDLAIQAGDRNHGVGTLIMTRLLDEAKTNNKPLNIQVIKNNFGAQRFYERLGFRFTGDEGMHFQMQWTQEEAGKRES